MYILQNKTTLDSVTHQMHKFLDAPPTTEIANHPTPLPQPRFIYAFILTAHSVYVIAYILSIIV